MELSLKDQAQLKEYGISSAQLEAQLKILTQGQPPLRLEAPCTLENGIETLSEEGVVSYGHGFTQAQLAGRCTQFVPASGAATRMFRDLLAYYHGSEEAAIVSRVEAFFQKLSCFAFFGPLQKSLSSQGKSLNALLEAKQFREVLRALLFEPGLNYAELPKALLYFHRSPEGPRLAMGEHLVEAAPYLEDQEGVCRLHFTLSPEYEAKVKASLDKILANFERSDRHFEVGFSFQDPATDTIAVDLQNNPFRDADGRILLRPGGHGALLKNLNALQGDIIFIKNIDNVVVDSWKPEVVRYQRALGGLLLELQQEIFGYLEKLEAKEFTEGDLQRMLRFTKERLGIEEEASSAKVEQQAEWLYQIFHRPLRVCGMVKNQGEPGGGPFWVRSREGRVTRQIVESVQVNRQDSEQEKIFQAATHFNPVNLVCGVCDHKRKPFDLEKFVDPQTAFITEKSYEGKKLKALEWPGLWNGAMAFWNTIFVEVPLSTFNPVKTVMDLLRPAHQGN